MRYGFVGCAVGYNYILGWDVLRQYAFGGIQEHHRHVLCFSGFVADALASFLRASLPQRIPEKQRRVPVVAVGSVVLRRFSGQHRPIGISCPCAQGSPVAPAAKITRQSSALIAPR